MFDINCGCGVWPFRPTLASDAASVEAILRAEGITRACGYPLEACFWPDPHEANELRLPGMAESPFWVPSAVLNPAVSGCMKGYSRCRQEWDVPMVRLFPSYHFYDLDEPAVDTLAEQAAADGIVLGVHGRLEGYVRSPLAQGRAFRTEQIGALAERHPDLRVVAFSVGPPMWEERYFAPREALRTIGAQAEFDDPPPLPENLWIELSIFEFECSFSTAVKLFSPERVLFGTNAPIFHPRPNVLKIKNSDASESAKRAALCANATELLGVQA
jgi:predicted TIM-barrel fold metal-dependent hydrolase